MLAWSEDGVNRYTVHVVLLSFNSKVAACGPHRSVAGSTAGLCAVALARAHR